ncbi:MAG TPA: Hsp20/alpha crystallin family protein [Gemmatimonadales bacterium]|jgi:HSP20 family protein
MRVALRTPIAGKLGEEFERVFDRILAPRWLPEPFLPEYPFEAQATEWIPVLEMVENADEFVVMLEVPGIPRENLDLNLTGQMLTITGKREVKAENVGEAYLVRERLYGKFVRTIRLPVPVAVDKVTAIYEDGMLRVHLPKAMPAPANKILIK